MVGKEEEGAKAWITKHPNENNISDDIHKV